jgi:long-chain-fatty-acid--CoA ligase ACSBG
LYRYIEDRLKSLMPGISNVMMIGDKKTYNTVLVTLRQIPDGDNGFVDDLFGNSLEVGPVAFTLNPKP